MRIITDIFLELFVEKNSDGTRALRLQGNELQKRIQRRLEINDMYKISRFLILHPRIKYVDLCYNEFGDQGISILTDRLFDDDENTIEELNIMHCDIGPQGIQTLSTAENLKLKKLRLSGNKLGPDSAVHLGNLIENCQCLEHIDLSETDQTIESIEYLLMAFEQYPLKVVDLSRIIQESYLSYCDNNVLVDCLNSFLKLNNTLTELHLEKCAFDGHDIELLLIGLKMHSNLLMLNLGVNNIGDHGTELLSKWLKTRPELIALKLNHNGIKNRGALALSLALPYSRVRYLDLIQNHIGDEGLSEILNSIKKPTPIRHLFIWGNTIGFMTLQRIERMLKSKLLKQELLDVSIYYVDGERRAAQYPAERFKCQYYCTRRYGAAEDLKIKRNVVGTHDSKPRALVNLSWIDRYPPVAKKLPPEVRFSVKEVVEFRV